MIGKNIEKLHQEFIYKSRYSRWNYKENRRESWEETVDRYFNFFETKAPKHLLSQFLKAKKYVLDLQVMPSMRSLWTAGEALEKENIAGYNCSALAINYVKAFADIMFISLNGSGVGISVERQFINDLPKIKKPLVEIDETVVVEDTKEGWAQGVLDLTNYLFDGKIPKIDVSKVRPAGSILKTFGGRASGPEPLVKAMKFMIRTFKNVGEDCKLSSLDCHDIACSIAEAVVVGGTRRSAIISLSNLSDLRMRHAKDGNFWDNNPQRAMANNSVAYTEKPSMKFFLDEWTNLMNSGSGERGIFNREAARKKIEGIGRRKSEGYQWLINPCGEIFLRPKQFCNLSEVIVRPNDTLNTLQEKVKYATILGVLQSTLTDFNFLDDEWKKNCEEERLCGVSLSGVMDHHVLNNEKKSERLTDWLNAMKETSINVAKKWSKELGINMATAITAIKPSGTASLRVGCSPGIHPGWSNYYIRRVRNSKNDPMTKFLIDKGVPWHPENGETRDNFLTAVFEFPLRTPSKRGILRGFKSAVEQLEHWKIVNEVWCEHEPSITVYVKDDEWLEVGSWVYKNWDIVSGISFLPYNNGNYNLTPFEEIDEERYKELVKNFPNGINFDDLNIYESEDYTVGAQELACMGGSCSL